MLVLTRKVRQQIRVGENITITIVRIKGNQVRVGIEAPEEMRVLRSEIVEPQPQSEPSGEPGRVVSSNEPVSDEDQPLVSALLRRARALRRQQQMDETDSLSDPRRPMMMARQGALT